MKKELADLLFMKETLEEELPFFGYAGLEREYGVNRYYIWHIINTHGYEPPRWVLIKLGIVEPRRRIVIDLPPDTPADVLAEIREMTKDDRLRRLRE